LGRGTFDLHIRSIMEGKSLPTRTVELDGSTDLDLDLDLR
jgi:hypothetical protein